MSGKKVGLLVCLFVVLTAAYEFIAIATPLSTWSRLIQGLPGELRIAIASTFAVTLVVFAGWVWRHIGFEERSDL